MNDRSIAVVMITVDRSPKHNYLDETIRNLARGGIWLTPFLRRFDLVISTNHFAYVVGALRGHASQPLVWRAERSYLACENAGRALKIGAESDAPWVLFCEDDIDVCDDFLGSVGRWLDLHGSDERYRLFAFGAAYDQTLRAYQQGFTAWEYPVGAFYGTQCFAIRSHDAATLGAYLESNPEIEAEVYNPNAYDLMIHTWVRDNYPEASFLATAILASCPSFVEHIGRESICTGKDETHRFASWQGREWKFEAQEAKITA